MRRISTATRVVDKFGAGKDGFTNGDAVAGLPSTDLEDVWFDAVQEEIANVVEGARLTLDPANRAQLLAAIQAMFAPVIGSASNLKCVTTAPGTSLPYSADQVVVGASLGGKTFCLSNFSAAISALDTGALAANSFYAVYAYLKSDGTKGGFLQLEPAGGAPTVYGGANPPANMIASALIGVWPTNASAQLIVGSQYGRRFNFASAGVLTGSGAVGTPTSFSISGVVPKSAKFVSGGLSITVAAGAVAQLLLFDQSSTGASSATVSNNTTGAGGNSNNFSSFPVLTPQTLWFVTSTSAGAISNYAANLTQYEF
jgi:hypothetical protein